MFRINTVQKVSLPARNRKENENKNRLDQTKSRGLKNIMNSLAKSVEVIRGQT